MPLPDKNWDLVLEDIDNGRDINPPFEAYYTAIIESFYASFPKISSQIKTNVKPWITSSLIVSIKEKNTLRRKAKRCPSDHNVNTYKNFRNNLNNQLRNAQKKYFQGRLESAKNIKQQWRIINEIINKESPDRNIKKLKIDNIII